MLLQEFWWTVAGMLARLQTQPQVTKYSCQMPLHKLSYKLEASRHEG